jgi:hypothetical protein
MLEDGLGLVPEHSQWSTCTFNMNRTTGTKLFNKYWVGIGA